MKKLLLLVLIGILLMGCSLPFTITWNNSPTPQVETPVQLPATATIGVIATESPATAAAPTAAPLNGLELNLGGVYMVLPPCMAANATGTLVPAVPYDENNGPMEYYPQNRKIAFQGYPLSGGFWDAAGSNKGGITIYPVADFVAMNQGIATIVSNMKTLLATRPEAPKNIPFLHIVGAAQVFDSNVKYLDFQNGQGVRFLTEYAQFSDPVNNHDLFYAYQGMTSDGKYWVSAILPVNAAYLQADYNSVDVPAGGIPAPSMDNNPNFSSDMDTYYVTMLDKLNTTPDNSFTPGLDCLDQYIQSLNISD